MRYLISVIDGDTGTATPGEMVAINAFNDDLRRNGQLVMSIGLTAPRDAIVIDNRGAAAIRTDGPFVESREYVAGFWIVDAPDPDVALKLAEAGSKACRRRVEVRPFAGA